MNNCKYCAKEIMNEGDFCGSCGLIKFSEEESVLKRLIKQFKYIFINPVAFIHTSKLVNPIFTGVTIVMIFLIQLILLRVTGNKYSLFSTASYFIVISVGIAAMESLFMLGISKGIYKKNLNYIPFLNLNLSVQLILCIILISGEILGACISPILFYTLCIFGITVSLLLLYQGIKDFVQANIMIHVVTLIGSFAGTALVIYIILRILAKNALQSLL